MQSIRFCPADKLFSRPDLLCEFLKRQQTTRPMLVEISVTEECNAACETCISKDTRGSGRTRLPKDIVDLLADELSRSRVTSITWTGGGEPLCHPDFQEMVQLMATRDINQGLFTNGLNAHKLDTVHARKLQWIRVTLTPPNYTLPPGVDALSVATQVGVVMNLTPSNISKLREAYASCVGRNVKYFQVRPALARTPEEQPPLDIQEAKQILGSTLNGPVVEYTDYKWDDCHKPHGYRECHGHNFCPFVWPNGNVGVCGYRWDYTFGNLLDKSFRSIWRSRILRPPYIVNGECQHCCKNHEINKLLAIATKTRATLDTGFI